MNQNVSIRIKGIYDTGEDKSEVELFTGGRMCKKGGKIFITYEESETTGFDGCTTILKIDEGCVTMTRKGESTAHLVLQQGIRNIGRYRFFGNMMDIGVFTDDLSSEFNEDGGTLHLRYTLDMNTSLLSENELFLDVKPIGGKGKDEWHA